MAVDTPTSNSQVTVDPSVSRVFLDALAHRRKEIFAHSEQQNMCDTIATFIFELFTRLARSNRQHIDGSLIQKLNDQLGRFEVPLSEVNITLPEGMILSLEHALTLGAPPPSTHEMINALFARGYMLHLEVKPPSERRGFTSQVIKLLPGIERLGPFLLSDYIDHACPEEDALRFWQLYVERVASELGRRTADVEEEPETWTLSALLRLHNAGPSALIGRKWEVLRRHIDRIIQSGQHEWRWRLLRVLIEACQDYKVLYFVLSSPAILEDKEIPLIFLTRGNSKLTSCALFLLQITRVSPKMINQVLEYFADRTLTEIGDRVVEIYAQTQLFEKPTQAIEVIQGGIESLVEHKLKSEPVDALINSINNDARAFRQNILLTEVVPKDRYTTTPTQSQVLERVLQSFFHSFTPSGVRHPLNDKIYHAGVARAIVELMRTSDSHQVAHLKSFGLNLNKAATRWLPDEEDIPRRKLLLSYFIGIYAYVIRTAARELYTNMEARPRALDLYRLLVELYISEPTQSYECNGYGSLNPIMLSLYPELISSEHMDLPLASRIEEVADLFAQIEEEQRITQNLSGVLSQWKDRNWGRDLASAPSVDSTSEKGISTELKVEELEVAETGYIPLVTHHPVSAPVVILSKLRTAPQSALRAYLGLDLFGFIAQKTLSFIGIRQYGELSLADEQILLKERHAHSRGQRLASKEVRFHASQVAGVSLHQPLQAFYYILGIFALLTFTFIGGNFLFAGVRGAEIGLGLLGLVLVGVGFLFDASMGALYRKNSRQVILELVRRQGGKPITVAVDKTQRAGQALLNAFVAQEAQRREDDFNQGWVEMAVQKSKAAIEPEPEVTPESESEEATPEGETPLEVSDDESNNDRVDDGPNQNTTPPILDVIEGAIDDPSPSLIAAIGSIDDIHELDASTDQRPLNHSLPEIHDSITGLDDAFDESIDESIDPSSAPPPLEPSSVALDEDPTINVSYDEIHNDPDSSDESPELNNEFATSMGAIADIKVEQD
jgi:hypothetical protein